MFLTNNSPYFSAPINSFIKDRLRPNLNEKCSETNMFYLEKVYYQLGVISRFYDDGTLAREKVVCDRKGTLVSPINLCQTEVSHITL